MGNGERILCVEDEESIRILIRRVLTINNYVVFVARDAKEAVDIFNRILVSVPDDFVSHVGMSIINDDQNKLDLAIWHRRCRPVAD